MIRIVKISVLFLLATELQAVPLSIHQLRDLQQQPCVFIHPWANWCSTCVVELPGLIPQLAKWKHAKPAVIDISGEQGQRTFSRNWQVLRESPMTLYSKPFKANDAEYQKQIDSEWDGSLPFSVLYIKGKKKKAWTGKQKFDALALEVESLCR